MLNINSSPTTFNPNGTNETFDVKQNNSCLTPITPRHDWELDELLELYNQPFSDLILLAQLTHRKYFEPNKVQCSTLLSIKTGGCPENCAYCPQSAHYQTGLKKESLLSKEVVLEHATQAKQDGSTRFCMGAAWRQIKDNQEFEQVLELVRSVKNLGLEVCCTLGMLTKDQAVRLKEAGCYAYNHNLDTSRDYYDKIITTRTYEDRLNTLRAVREAGITVCCGGILGMGESINDRLGLLIELTNQTPHPESVPLNMLVKVKGTPLANEPQGGESSNAVDELEFVRMVALTRITLPKSMVRLSAGRNEMSDETQALCFLAGANSIFSGDKLLTTKNPETSRDAQLFEKLGITYMGI